MAARRRSSSSSSSSRHLQRQAMLLAMQQAGTAAACRPCAGVVCGGGRSGRCSACCVRRQQRARGTAQLTASQADSRSAGCCAMAALLLLGHWQRLRLCCRQCHDNLSALCGSGGASCVGHWACVCGGPRAAATWNQVWYRVSACLGAKSRDETVWRRRGLKRRWHGFARDQCVSSGCKYLQRELLGV
jgi:hypothetical protein